MRCQITNKTRTRITSQSVDRFAHATYVITIACNREQPKGSFSLQVEPSMLLYSLVSAEPLRPSGEERRLLFVYKLEAGQLLDRFDPAESDVVPSERNLFLCSDSRRPPPKSVSPVSACSIASALASSV